MQKKLLLINPNFYYFPGWAESFVNYKQLPLGLAYIASYIREYCQIDLKICDAALLNFTENEVMAYVNEIKPDIVGITTHTPTINFARGLATLIKRRFPETFVVFGGAHVSALPFEALDIADICVLGEGEITFKEVVDSLLCNRPLSQIEGISYKDRNVFYKTSERNFIQDLDSLPFPARDLFPAHKYCHRYPYQLKNSSQETIITSRGCSFNCTFCQNNLMWKRNVRNRSLDNIFTEIEELIKKNNLSLLRIEDDNFTDNKLSVIKFCEIMKKRFPELRWVCHARADSLDYDMLKEMKEAKCVEVQMGIESGDDRILEKCNKSLRTDTIRKVAKIFKKVGINYWTTFMIGNDGEDERSIEKTIEFAKEIDPAYCSFLFLNPFPGTESYKALLEKGQLKSSDWSKYNFHSAPVFETELLTKKKLMKLRRKAYISFYIRPLVLKKYFVESLRSRQFKLAVANFLLLIKFLFNLIGK